MDGRSVGLHVVTGALVGSTEGETVGIDALGLEVGISLGVTDGTALGLFVGIEDSGAVDGFMDGVPEGLSVTTRAAEQMKLHRNGSFTAVKVAGLSLDQDVTVWNE